MVEHCFPPFFRRQIVISQVQILHKRRMRSDWLILIKFALQVTIDMSHAATCLATLRKEKDSSTFPVTCNTSFCCIAGCENWVLHVQFFSQLATQQTLRCKLQEKLRRVTRPLGGHSNLSVRDHWARTGHFKRGRDNFRLHSLECGASV